MGTRERSGRRLVRRARYRIRKLDAPSLIALCMKYLMDAPSDGIDWYRRTPVLPLLIIKWSAEFSSPKALRRAAAAE